MIEVFEFPKIHSFPPLYTKQANVTVFQKQLDAWCDIVVAYCEHYKITSLSLHGNVLHSQLDLNGKSLPSLFENKDLNRTANRELREEVFRHLINRYHRGEFINSKRTEEGVLIYWRSLSEWAMLLHNHLEATGQLGQVLTIYELTKSDEDSTMDNELRNLDYNLLVRVLKRIFMKQGKAQILMNEDGTEIGGVKIV